MIFRPLKTKEDLTEIVSLAIKNFTGPYGRLDTSGYYDILSTYLINPAATTLLAMDEDTMLGFSVFAPFSMLPNEYEELRISVDKTKNRNPLRDIFSMFDKPPISARYPCDIDQISPKDYYAAMMCVKEEHRGKGVGTALADERAKLAKANGAENIFVHC